MVDDNDDKDNNNNIDNDDNSDDNDISSPVSMFVLSFENSFLLSLLQIIRTNNFCLELNFCIMW